MTGITLERIRHLLEVHDYVPNMNGRSLGKSGSRLVAVIETGGSRDGRNGMGGPIRGELVGLLEEELRRAGYFMLLYVSRDIKKSLRVAASWNVEGIIVTGCGGPACRAMIEGARNLRKPAVFVDAVCEGDDFYGVGFQDREGGRMMARHLIGLGHRKIAFLGEAETLEDAERREGVREAHEEAGISWGEENHLVLSGGGAERREIMDLLIREKLRGFSALFFASDILAAWGINSLRDAGIRVPGDISVAGFGDGWFAENTRPRLTTLRQDVPLKAARAAAQLLTLLRRGEAAERRILLPVELVSRESVAAPGAAPYPAGN